MTHPIERRVNYAGTTATFIVDRRTTTMARGSLVAAMKDIEAERVDVFTRNGIELDWQTLKDAVVDLDMAAEKYADLKAEASFGWQA